MFSVITVCVGYCHLDRIWNHLRDKLLDIPVKGYHDLITWYVKMHVDSEKNYSLGRTS